MHSLRIDPKSGVPKYVQIKEHFESLIANCTLTLGEQLPTIRELSVELTMNPKTGPVHSPNWSTKACWPRCKGALPSSSCQRIRLSWIPSVARSCVISWNKPLLKLQRWVPRWTLGSNCCRIALPGPA